MDFFENINSGVLSSPTNLSLVILSLPFFSFLVLFFFAKHMPRKGDMVATASAGLTFILSTFLFLKVWGKMVETSTFSWFAIGSHEFTVSIKIDDLSVTMLLLVSFISFLVHAYSIEYMKGKRNYSRYFPYLGIFTFSMMGIVLSDNLLITFMFWELVGFSSYLLIGFWYDKDAAVQAAKKAFLFNIIGDTGFIIALLAVFALFSTFDISTIRQQLVSGEVFDAQWIFWIGLGIFMGCIGKSAQFPFQAWLPDAMEGPTPVSALIHAATMVAAGVYLLIKINFLLDADVLTIIAFIGAITAFMGALPALFQNDIKKVLAYSTISQLGYMVMAVGVGAFNASFFHLITHGFFKACLFLSAGAVIHSMHEMKHELFVRGEYTDIDSQDMRLMGGFKTMMPLTFICFIISAFALIGLPLFSGFLSKDAILEAASHWAVSGNNPALYIIPVLAFLTVFITALYMTRQIVMVFMGEFRLEKQSRFAKDVLSHMKDPSMLMLVPLLVLAPLCLWIVFSINPLSAEFGWIFKTGNVHTMTALISIIFSLGGIALGYLIFSKKKYEIVKGENEQGLSLADFIRHNWFLDRIYYYILVVPGFKTAKIASYTDKKVIDGFIHFIAVFNVVLAHVIAWLDRFLVDGLVNASAVIASKLGGFFRGFQTGRIQGYFIFALMATIILIVWIIIL